MADEPIFSAEATFRLGKAFLKGKSLVVLSDDDRDIRTAALQKLLEGAPPEMLSRSCALSTNEGLIRTFLEEGVLAIHLDPARGTNIATSLETMLRLEQPLVILDPLDVAAALDGVRKLVKAGAVVIVTAVKDQDLLRRAMDLSDVATPILLQREATGLWGCNFTITSKI